MKNSIFFLGIALLTFVNVSTATNTISTVDKEKTTIKYDDVTPLCVAISKGELEIVKKFIEYGADVNQKSNGLTPLMIAARYNKAEIVKYLLEDCDVKINEKDDNGLTALNYAEISNATETIQLLKNYK
ncbi:ankyrin repeat domain-containing protein [Flavobacterium sp.]|uniref:ankyrin repeat domain-containing protein n=1 Tax=Flavobacterium sp. TaxID=239 RepID=UPI002BACAFD6|nr:ankyrin repeat domain-containing protein [Flavobacterium sp.]HSD05746.1 ankyrin repeat domain-containing protein [Flavobacterium sp.]